MLIDGFDYDPGWGLTVVRNPLKGGVLIFMNTNIPAFYAH